ncbi:MAG: DUF2267 domain-containing protein [Alphaproteobacteria bacterium]|nr:MAG: DUF2267 domain-containing protein [Alphaproteobacteria bacterium]
MSALGLPIIDNAVQDANRWINEVNERVGWDNKPRAYRLLRQVLHVVRDHLNVDEAAQLGAQLPTLIRGIYYEGWDPSKTPVKMRKPEEFVAAVQAGFQGDPLGDAPQAIAAVFAVLDAHVSAGEMEEVKQAFTKEIRELFGAVEA